MTETHLIKFQNIFLILKLQDTTEPGKGHANFIFKLSEQDNI